MARLRNRNMGLPCGFPYLQAQTGKQFKEGGFNELVTEIVKHRKANPQHKLNLDWGTVANEAEEYIVKVLLANPRWHRFVALQSASPQASPKAWSPQQFLRKAGNAVGVVKTHVKNTVAGIGLYVEWFGSGGSPVEREEAERRASICIGCPKMVPGDYYQRWGRAVGYEIMTVLAIINDLQLATKYDDVLQVCDACDCPMKAKVWSPLDVIKRHMRKEAEDKLWEKCWLLPPKTPQPPPKPQTKADLKPTTDDSRYPSIKRGRKTSSPIIEVD